jgi:hypothetical protein
LHAVVQAWSAAQAETPQQRAIALNVHAGKVIKQASPLAHQLQQASARRMVFGVVAKMISEG